MYGWIWRILPGPWWVKLMFSVAIVLLVLFVLGAWVFPWAAEHVFQQQVTVG